MFSECRFMLYTISNMNCQNCVRTTLGLFIRSLTTIEPAFNAPRRINPSFAQSLRHHTSPTRAARRSTFRTPTQQPSDGSPTQPSRSTTRYKPNETPIIPSPSEPQEPLDGGEVEDSFFPEPPAGPSRPAWAIQKEALRAKLGGEAWSPRKKLSPDTLEGIRHLHATQPDKFTTPVLADYFKVSPEAIRRILKSKWRPNDEEYEARMQRWDKRGERIWTNLVEMGVKPPKKWREMGVGKVEGDRPKWKGRYRNVVDVRDSVGLGVDDWMPNEEIIPIVGGKGSKTAKRQVDRPLTERL